MDMLVGLPEPEDLPREEVPLTVLSLKEEIRRLRDKYGQPGAAILAEVESIVTKYENSLTTEAKSSSGVNAALANLDQETVIKAQHIVRAFLKRKKFASVAAHFLSSPLAKELGKRNEIWREILQTEKAYFQSLVMLYETFYKPLKMKSVGVSMNQDHKILTEKQILKIFQNIEDVKNSAKNMWKKLEETCKNWPESAPRIGQVTIALMQEIRAVYSPYVKGLAKSMTNLAKMRKQSQQFSDYLDRTGSDFAGSPDQQQLPLHSLLMLPLHRMGQYENFLKELTLLTPPEHVDYAELTRARGEVAALNFDLAPAKAEAFKAQKLYHINANLRGANVPNILAGKVEGTRIYIREGPILSVGDRRNKRSYVFLFTDSLVLADINEATEEKQFDFMLPLVGAEIKEVHDSAGATFFNHSTTSSGGVAQHLFALIKENKKLVLGCNTLSERASWMNDISTVINELSNTKRTGGGRSLAPKLSLARAAGGSGSSLTSPRDASAPVDGARAASSTSPAASALISSDAFLRSLSRQHATKTIEQFIEVIPNRVRLTRAVPRDFLAKFRAPTEEESDSEKYTSFAAAKVTSTYPFDKERNVRMGDPIKSNCGLIAWGNRILAVLADGCGRGFRPQQAATRAVETFLSDFVDPKYVPQDLRELSGEMLRSFSHVHENIISGSQVVWDAATTTFLGAFLVEVEPSSASNNLKWCLVVANIGDGKAFIWNKSTKTIREASNRMAPYDMRDPGGRLGPYIYEGGPDLRDMSFSASFCSEDDFVILCSDGVYDNFDPELSGLTPKDFAHMVGSNANSDGPASPLLSDIRPEQLKNRWDQLDALTSSELRAVHRAHTLETIIEGGDSSPNARSIMRSIVNYCIRQTRSAREFLEQNPAQRLPVDYQQFPGSLDHLACLAFQVGSVQV